MLTILELLISFVTLFGGLAYLGAFKLKAQQKSLPIDWKPELATCPLCGKRVLILTGETCLTCKNDALFASIGMHR